MTRIIFRCGIILEVLLIATSDQDFSAENAPFEQNESGHFERWVKYNLSYTTYWGTNYTEDFDSGFLTAPDKLVQYSQNEIKELLKEGASRYLASLVGYKIFVVDRFLIGENVSQYSEPIIMPNISYKENSSSSTIKAITFHNVKLYGLVNVTALDSNLGTSDAELFSLFTINIVTPIDVINVCGQHVMTTDERDIIGSFCYEILNSTHETTYYAQRNRDGNIQVRRIHEKVKYEIARYTDITFSEEFQKWPALELEHNKKLTLALAEHYLIPVSSRIRSYAEKNGFLRMTELFSSSYRNRISRYMFLLMQQYLKNLPDPTRVETDEITFNLHNYSNFSINENTKMGDNIEQQPNGLVSKIGIQLYYPTDFLVSIAGEQNGTFGSVDHIAVNLKLRFSPSSAKVLDLAVDDIKLKLNFRPGHELADTLKGKLEQRLLKYVFEFLQELNSS